MPFTPPARFIKETEKDRIEPVLIVRFNLAFRVFLRVKDFSDLTPNPVITITINGTPHTLTQGTDFTAAGSNAATAEAIRAAFMSGNPITSIERLGVIARIEGPGLDIVSFTSAAGATSLAVSSNNIDFADNEPTDAATTRHFCTGDQILFPNGEAIKPIISTATFSEQKIDAMSRHVSIGDLDLVFWNNDEIRKLLSTYPVLYEKVDLFLGTREMNDTTNTFASQSSAWAQLPSMFVVDFKPDKTNRVTVKLSHPLKVVGNRDIAQFDAVVEHPLETLKRAIEVVDPPPSRYFDTTNMDPTLSSLWGDISHWTISRFDRMRYGIDGKIHEAVKAIDVINSLMTIIPGTLKPGQDGRVTLVPFDFNAAADRTWASAAGTGHDIDEVEQIETLGQTATLVKIEFGFKESEGELIANYQEADVDSANILRDPAFAPMVLSTKWINSLAGTSQLGIMGPSNTPAAVDQIFSDTESFLIFGPGQGLAGCRFTKSGGVFTQKTAARLEDSDPGSGRRMLLRLEPTTTGPRIDVNLDGSGARIKTNSNDDGPEIIAISDVSVDAGTASEATTDVPVSCRLHIDTDFNDEELQIGSFSLSPQPPTTPGGRGGLGTSIPFTDTGIADPSLGGFWGLTSGVRVVDITIPVAMAKARLRRFKFGAPIIRVRTSMREWGLELGDFVNLSGDDTFLGFGRDGLNSAVIFEVTGIRYKFFDDNPVIEWELTFVRDDFVPTFFPEYSPTTIDPAVLTSPLDDVVQALSDETDPTSAIVDVYSDTTGDGNPDETVRALA